MAMIAKRGLVYSMLCVLLLGAFLGVSQPVDASSGSINIAPGETKYLSFGTCSSGDVLLWDLEISTWSTIFTYWLETPADAHLPLESLTWGRVILTPGEWRLGFSIDISGWWSATVYYTIYRTTPHVEITSPLGSSYVNQASITVSGTVDTFATEVEMSIDHVHYEDADLYLGNWNWPVILPGDGEYTIYAEGTIIWGSYGVKYYDEVSVTLDTMLPEVGITAPADDSYIAGTLDLAWQCSDESGIALTEVKIDLLDWNTVDGSEYSCGLSDGEHTAKVRVTDVAGNTAIDSVTVTSDTLIPLVAITSPANNSYVAGAIDIAWQCSDECGVALVEVKVDLLDWNTVTGSEYSCDVSDGTHTVKVRVTDFAGNMAIDEVIVTSDTVAPTLALIAPANNSCVAGILDLSWQCSDECEIALREVKVDALDWVTVDGTEHNCDLSDGTHTVMVRITDLAGNSAVASTTVLSDTANPLVTVNAPSADSKLSKDAVPVTWTGSDALSGIDHYEVKIGGGSWVNVGTDTTYTFTDLEDKWYSVTVKAVDKSGNTEESSVSFGIYTSIWSTDGPYQGIPLFALIAVVGIAVILSVLLLRRRRGGAAVTTVPEEESAPETAPTRVRTLK